MVVLARRRPDILASDETTVVLVTALKDEFDQVLNVNAGAIDPAWRIGTSLDGRMAATRRFHTPPEGSMRFVVTWATQMGGVAASALAASLVAYYQPQCLAMCGICAGRQGKVNLGDVIFADRLWTYDSGKTISEFTLEGMRADRFEGDMMQYHLPDAWKQQVQSYQIGESPWLLGRPRPLDVQSAWLVLHLLEGRNPYHQIDRDLSCPDWALTIGVLRRRGYLASAGLALTESGIRFAQELHLLGATRSSDPSPFAIHLAPIATGTPVVEDPDIFKRLSLSMRKVLGLEMEASAIGLVGDLHNVPTIVAKGVSDFAVDKEDRHRLFAARAAAECLVGFLRLSLPWLLSDPRPLRSTLPHGLDETGTTRIGQSRPKMLPRDLVVFTGRQSESTSLSAALSQDHSSSNAAAYLIHSVDGMPGVGKTALAVHVAHLVKDSFPDGQVFLELHGYTPGRDPVSPAAALDRLLRTFGVPGSRIPEELDERAALWRSELAGLRALIILDNARSYEQIRYLLPGASRSRVLITSRQQFVALVEGSPISLAVLSLEESVELLIGAAGHNAETSDRHTLELLARLCGCLPLALQLIGNRWKHRSTWSAQDLLTRISDARTSAVRFDPAFQEVASAFRVSYDGLGEQHRSLFRRLGLHPGVDLTSDTATVLTDSTTDATRLLDDLVAQSLVTEGARGRYHFHDLLRAYARDTAQIEEREDTRHQCIRRLFDYYLQASDIAASLLDPHRRSFTIPAPTDLLPTPTLPDRRAALQWSEDERLNILACIRLANEQGDRTVVCNLSHLLAHFLSRAGYTRDALDIHTSACGSARILGDPQLEARAHTDLAQSYQDAGAFEESLHHYSVAMGLWSELRDADGLATALAGAGFTLERTGDYSEALASLERALAIRKDMGHLSGEAHVLNASGAVYWRLHDYPRALECFNDALLIRRAIGDSYGEAHTVNNIGFTYQRLGQHGVAESWLQDALRIAHDIGDRGSEAVTLNNLSYTFGATGQEDQALAYARRGLEMARLIGSLYQEGRALDGMARALVRSDPQSAATNWRLALGLFEKAGVPEAEEVRTLLTSMM